MHSRIPGLLLTQYCAENSQQLAHRSDDGDLARLASLTQALIEGANGRIAPRGRQGRHVQHAAHIPPAAGDMPGFVLCAALIGIRRNAHNGRRFLAIDGPQVGQAEQQVPCGDRADAGASSRDIFGCSKNRQNRIVENSTYPLDDFGFR